jgi:adenylate cyclase
MDAALKPPRKWRSGLLAVALTPVVPQLLGSVFNVWYNAAVVVRLLSTPELKHSFLLTCVLYNLIVYPVATWVWLRCVWSLRPVLGQLAGGNSMPKRGALNWARRRVIDLPWRGAAVAGTAWLLCIPVFLLALWCTDHHLDPRLWWHISVSFLVSAIISVTHSFFLIELVCHKTLFPVFFRDARADQVPGARALSVTARGVIWAVSAGLCPIGSLLLLALAPAEPGKHELWLAIFVGVVGIAFGLCTAVMIMRFLSEPLGHLRKAAHAVAQGRLDVQVELRRADEFGVLIEEFNQMIRELREKERLRRTFGLHVGRQAAEEILARDPGLSGLEEEITVMFADIRSFTERSAGHSAAEMVEMLNGFLQVMVRVVEGAHGGMVNKFLGDGFIALFGVGGASRHAQAAVEAAREMVEALGALNAAAPRGREPIAIGIGLHTGRAVVGSIGSPERLEFTAIGSTVNLASRIEGLTKSLGATLLITEATWRELIDREGFVELPPQRVRGVEELVKVYALGLPALERSDGAGDVR